MKNIRVKRRVGDVVEVSLGNGYVGFGIVLKEPLIAFFNVRTKERLSIDAILEHSIAFSIWVMNHAVTKGEWEVIGHAEVPATINQRPPFFKKDPISGKLSITYDGGDETSTELQQVKEFERAAVWEPSDVVDRLNDHFDGKPNTWVEMLRTN